MEGFSVKEVEAPSPRGEVRTCGRCGHAALVCLHGWDHSINGASTGRVTRECRCQSCGTVVKLHDPALIRMGRILGIVLMCSVVGFLPGVIVFVAALRRDAKWRHNPVVAGGSLPAIRYPLGPGNRRCAACGATARIVAMTRTRHNGIPTGTDYDYACVACDHRFQTESGGGILLELVAGALCATFGIVALTSHAGAGVRFGLGGFLLLGGVAALYQAGRHVLAALHNPTLS